VSIALSVAMSWFVIYLNYQAFPFILASLKIFGTIYMLAAISLCAGLFYLFVLPETKVKFICLNHKYVASYSYIYFLAFTGY